MSTTQSALFVSSPMPKIAAKAAALALPGILAAALILRVYASWSQTRVLFFDETLQYFEQGHRLAFGSGVVPWEYVDGIRSWLLPGLIALVMTACSWVGDHPGLYIGAVRGLCILLSLSVVLIGYRAGERQAGRMGALLTGGFCAVWFDLIFFAPAAMTEVLAAHLAIAAFYLGETQRTKRAMFWIGVLFGFAVCLRYQYAPALMSAILWQYRAHRDLWPWLILGGGAVLLPFSGVLDAITWGAAFQSIWLNFSKNSLQGIAAAIGVEPPGFYLEYLSIALAPLPLLLGLAALGARRFPTLAIAAVATVAMHSVLPHKEARFIYLALAAAPILIGLGLADALTWLARRQGPRVLDFGAPAALVLGALLSWFVATGPMADRWSVQRGMVRAFLAAHAAPDLCGLQVRDMPIWQSGGYTYLHRDVPLTFDPHQPEIRLPNVAAPLRFLVERNRGPVPQLRSPYSHVIAEAAHPPLGFDTVACFPGDAKPGEPELCLFRRPSGCGV